jgi:hypothetical protein
MLIYMVKCSEWKEELYREIPELYESEGRRNLIKWKRKVLKYLYEDWIYLISSKRGTHIMTAAISCSIYYEFSFKRCRKCINLGSNFSLENDANEENYV